MVVGENTTGTGQYEGFIKEQLDAETICDKTAMILRGYRFDPNQREFTNIIKLDVINKETKQLEKIEITTEPILNEEGIKEVMTELRSRIANVFGSGSLTNQEIKTTRHAVAEVLWKKLRHNRIKYELSLENLESVLFIVDDQLMLFLSRTEKGGFLRALGRMIGRKENVNMNLTEQGKPGAVTKGGLFN